VRYRIVPERSRLWAWARSSLHLIEVETGAIHGVIDAQMTKEGLDLSFPTRSEIEVPSQALKTGNFLYDRELARQLEVTRYPTVRGVLTRVSGLGGLRYQVRARLFLHGVERELEAAATLSQAHDQSLLLEGEQTIDMRDFALNPPRFLMLKVYPQVRVRMRIWRVPRAEVVLTPHRAHGAEGRFETTTIAIAEWVGTPLGNRGKFPSVGGAAPPTGPA